MSASPKFNPAALAVEVCLATVTPFLGEVIFSHDARAVILAQAAQRLGILGALKKAVAHLMGELPG